MNNFYISEMLPTFQAKLGEMLDPYDSNYGNRTVLIVGTTKAEYLAYNDAIVEGGAILYAENDIAGNLFKTYTFTAESGEEYFVHTVHYHIVGNTRIVWGKKGFLPTYDEEVFNSGNVRTSVMQYARTAVYNSQPATGASGMAYIITLADGNFILIDGGPRQNEQHFTKALVDGEWVDAEPGEEQDCDKLYRLLKEKTPEGKKPLISAWFITHGHGDHTDLAGDFLRKYKDQVEVKLAAYNLPDPLVNPTKNENNDILSVTLRYIVEGFELVGAEHWAIRSGQRMSFPGCEVEILHTHEDYGPKPYVWCNHTSSAFRFKFKGKIFLVLGDCESDICYHLAYKYGKEIKCDILQPTHHGANGGNTILNATADPDVCLWPIDAYRFYTDARMLGFQRGYDYNWVLRNDEFRKRLHYHGSEDIEIFTDEK